MDQLVIHFFRFEPADLEKLRVGKPNLRVYSHSNGRENDRAVDQTKHESVVIVGGKMVGL